MFSEKPVIQGACNGIPIRRFGFTWMLEEAPDLIDDVPLQVGNGAAYTKVHPKNNWEIGSNRLGATATRMPRIPENDYLPLEAIHLIDGSTETCWSSRSRTHPDAEPAWIRLDLPLERTVQRIVLRKQSPGGFRRRVGMHMTRPDAVEVGRGMPAELTIKVSRDACHWETVFDGPTGDTPDRDDFEFSFPALPAKQIWPSEIEKAKVVAQIHVEHTALGVESFFCELYHIDYACDLSLTRRSFAADPVAPQQPQAALYVTRNLGTALEDLEPAQFGYSLDTTVEIKSCTLRGPHDHVLALWLPGRPHDSCTGVAVDVWVDLSCQTVIGYEPLNGTMQPLTGERHGQRTLLRGILVRDYPVLLRFA
jgi:hypothetical protein